MEAHELEVMKHYTANGSTQVAVIPQYSVPPGEQWSIDCLGLDLINRALLFIEVTGAQRPGPNFLDKIKRRREWIPLVRERLFQETRVVDPSWQDFVVVFVVDRVVDWVRAQLGNPGDVKIEPLSRCYPMWLTGRPHTPGEPRPKREDARI